MAKKDILYRKESYEPSEDINELTDGFVADQPNAGGDRTQKWVLFSKVRDWLNNFFARNVESIVALEALTGTKEGQIIKMSGYYAGVPLADMPDYIVKTGSVKAPTGGAVIARPEGGNFEWGDIGIVNVKWYGAKGGGTTDDSTFIQATINNSRQIYIPSGTFKAEGLLMKSEREFIGAGINSTLFIPVSTTGTVSIIGNSVALFNFKMADFSVDADRTDGVLDDSGLIQFEGCSYIVLDRIEVRNPFCHCFDFVSCSRVSVRDCTALLTNTYDGGATPDDGFGVGEEVGKERSFNIRFERCYARGFNVAGNESGFEVDDGPINVVFDSCMAEDCNNGFTVHTHDNELPVDDITIINCRVLNSTSLGITVHSRVGAPITGVNIIGNVIDGAVSQGIRILNITGGVTTKVVARENFIKNVGNGLFNESTDLKFINNHITNVTTDYTNTDHYNQLFFGNSPKVPTFDWDIKITDESAVEASFTLNHAKWESLPGNLIRLSFRISALDVTGLNGSDNLLIANLPKNATTSRETGAVLTRGAVFSTGYLTLNLQTSVILIENSRVAGAQAYLSCGGASNSEIQGQIIYEISD